MIEYRRKRLKRKKIAQKSRLHHNLYYATLARLWTVGAWPALPLLALLVERVADRQSKHRRRGRGVWRGENRVRRKRYRYRLGF